MRAILDMKTRKVVRNCGSINAAARTFAMLQIERDAYLALCAKAFRAPRESRNPRFAIVEVKTARHIGDSVPEGEFTVIHEEKK